MIWSSSRSSRVRTSAICRGYRSCLVRTSSATCRGYRCPWICLRELVISVFLVLPMTCAVPLGEFYPLGPVAGDTVLSANDDGSSEPLQLNVPFVIFPYNFWTVYVNNNGHISFSSPVSAYTPQPLPITIALVASYWGDVISGSVELGQVYFHLYCSLDYHQIGNTSCNNTDTTVLDIAMSDVRTAFCDLDFVPRFVLVASWFQVGYYRNGIDKKNTFQAVLTSDGVKSYVTFLYQDGGIEWTTGDASDGSNGLGGTPALAGINAGDGVHSYTLPTSLTDDVIDIEETSNVDVPGKWIFRVDTQLNTQTFIQPLSSGSTDCLAGACEQSDPCQNGGICVNTAAGSSCICTAEFSGDLCEQDSGLLYAFGLKQGDRELPPGALTTSPQMPLDLGCFPFGSNRHSAFYVSTSGHVSFDRRLLLAYPSTVLNKLFPVSNTLDCSVVAPFWTRVNTAQARCGQVFYHSYTLQEPAGQSYLDRASSDVYLHSPEEFGDFSARWVLVATWDEVCIYPSYRDKNTFQLVITSDGYDSFAILNYPDEGIKEQELIYRGSEQLTPEALVGFTSSDNVVFANYYLAGDPMVVRIDEHEFESTETAGKLFYHLTPDPNNPCKQNKACLNWYDQDVEKEGLLQLWTLYVPPCPCSLEQAETDDRYQQVMGNSATRTCYESIIPVQPYNVQTECCYSLLSDARSLIVLPPYAGSANRYHSDSDNKRHVELDVKPYDECCNKADLCYIYYKRRLSIGCTLYRPPNWVWLWGDPHIVTLDGRSYTFNGLGEYILMKTVNETFVLEGRTRLVTNSTATVFSAIVAGQFSKNEFINGLLESSVVHAELTPHNRLMLLACCYGNYSRLDSSSRNFNSSAWWNITSDFYNVPINSSLFLDNVVVTRRGDQRFVMLFSLEIAVRVEVKTNSLAFVLVAPLGMKGNTEGLVGVWDDDIGNDLAARNGSVLPQNSTDREIHSYAQTWQIYHNESLFHYGKGDSVDSYAVYDHVPVFADELVNSYTLEQREMCQDDPACLFDAFETGDVQFGLETLDTSVANQMAVATLNMFPPTIHANSTVMQATLGHPVEFTFNVTDDTAFNVTLRGQPPPIEDYNLTIAGDVVMFVWTPTNTDSVSLLFVATGVDGLSSQIHPLVRLCACRFDKNATCVEAETDGGSDRFVLENCQCGQGWEGRFCGIDIDGCSTASCIFGANCTDHPAPEVGFNCYPCPVGTAAVLDGLCEDVDECDNRTLNECDQVCINTEPGYHCSCEVGFQIDVDGLTCLDVNECNQTVQLCHHSCNNTMGSYQCTCADGFYLMDDNITCAPIASCSRTNCTQICSTIDMRNETCSCFLGYRLQTDGVNCSDIDECAEGSHRCNHICHNSNGSYRCDCHVGYRLEADGFVCRDVNECAENATLCPIAGQICENFLGSYQCECPHSTQLIGGSCTVIDDCASAPCKNGGRCIDGVDSFTCQCESGYQGDTCEDEVNECTSDPCMNGGICSDKLDGFDCLCSSGYAGDMCQTDINECLSAPCQHGSTCKDQVASYRCVCTDRWTGDQCQVERLCIASTTTCQSIAACFQRTFPCGDETHVNTMLNELCLLASSDRLSLSAKMWVGNVADCFSHAAAEIMTNVYGLERQDIPVDSECNLVDRLTFQEQKRCLSESLCNVTFSYQDAIAVARLLAQSVVYKHRSKEQMLDLLLACPHSGQSEALRDTLEREGYVICLKLLAGDQASRQSVINNAIQFLTDVTGAVGVHTLGDSGSDMCSQLYAETLDKRRRRDIGREKRSSANETLSEFVGILTNGTNATSQQSLCDTLNAPVNGSFEIRCPVCGNGMIEAPDEVCDDGNRAPGDGCSANCTVEEGSDCETTGLGSICYNKTCGDGIRVSGEECDSGGGSGCDPTHCGIMPNFTCPINPPFGTSNCSRCGNGVVEALESCDDGNLKDEDGCNSSCFVTPFFRCSRVYLQRSTCRYSQIDLDISDTGSLNRSVVYRRAGERVFLADPNTLDTDEIGDEDWEEMRVALLGSSNLLKEGVDVSLGTAIVNGRLSVVEYNSVAGALTWMSSSVGLTTEMLVIRRVSGKPVHLRHVVLALIYEHDDDLEPDHLERVVTIDVLSVYSGGVRSPLAAVTVRYVGENLNAPVVFILRNMSVFTEASLRPISVTGNSLVVTDADYSYYTMKSATVKIQNGRLKEFLNITLIGSPLSVRMEENDVISLQGNASPSVYSAALNNVSYFNNELDVFGLPDVVVVFSVFDGEWTGSSRVTIRLINVNVAPNVTFNGTAFGEINFVEGGGPSALVPAVIVNDGDHTHLIRALVRLINGHRGDRIGVLRSLPTNVTVAVSPVDNDMVVELSGRATLIEYMKLLSSVYFDNTLPLPLNLSLETRLLEISVDDGQNVSNTALVHVSITHINDGPVLQFSRMVDPVRVAARENRTVNASFVEEGQPITLLPDTAILFDVDSVNAAAAQVNIVRMRKGDRLNVNVTLAAFLGISVFGSGSQSLNLSGITLLEDYRMVLLTCTYQNTKDTPEASLSVVQFTVTDDAGAASLPAIVIVNTVDVNDAPDVDAGVGVNVTDTVYFTEGRQSGIHIFSRPHRIAYTDEENHCIAEVNVTLVATVPGSLNDGEFIFYSCFPLPAGIQMIPQLSGKKITFVMAADRDNARTCEATVRAFKDALSCVFYFNSEEEPSVYVSANSTVEIERKILIEVTDEGFPPATGTAVSYVKVETINDRAPVVKVDVAGDCVTTPSESRVRRYLPDSLQPPAVGKNGYLQRQAPSVVSVVAYGPFMGQSAMLVLIVQFSHETNQVPLARPVDLRKTVEVSYALLSRFQAVGIWNDSSTLIIIMSNISVNAFGEELSTGMNMNMAITFKERGDPCLDKERCLFGVCHASQDSCHVAGTFTARHVSSTANNYSPVPLHEIREEQVHEQF